MIMIMPEEAGEAEGVKLQAAGTAGTLRSSEKKWVREQFADAFTKLVVYKQNFQEIELVPGVCVYIN